MLLGAHVSIAGGYVNALAEAQKLGINAIQIFTKNQRFWREKEISEEEGRFFREQMPAYGVKQAFSHAIYLISLGSENEDIVQKSMLSLAMELDRCRKLGLTHTVLHPGAAGRSGTDAGIRRIGDNLKRVLSLAKNNPVKILLENTTGAGTSVGGRLENLADLISHIRSPQIGLCIDTCHAYAAGYDIRTPKGTETFFSLVDKTIGLEKLQCFHLNDSKGDLASRLDRHQHIGQGLIGPEPFRYIMRHFPHLPKVIETSKENNGHQKDIKFLRKLIEKK